MARFKRESNGEMAHAPSSAHIHKLNAAPVNAKLAYAICGIGQDGEGTVTFLPAFGRNYVWTKKPAHIKKAMETRHDRCIHNHTWTEIIEMICKDPHVFDGCLKNGCVKSMPLFINKTLRSTGWTNRMYESETGDGPSALKWEIADEFKIWQPGRGYWRFRYGDTTGGYPASRIRAVLNGCDSYTAVKRANGNRVYVRDDENDPASDWNICKKDLMDIRKITRDNCLLSCFPREVQEVIIPKRVKCLMDGRKERIVVVKDKLWLPSMSELYPGRDWSPYENEGSTYSSNSHYQAGHPWPLCSEKLYINKRIWTRSPTYDGDQQCYMHSDEGLLWSCAYCGIEGLAPGFVIGKKNQRTTDHPPC